MDDLIRRIDAIHALTQSADYIADALERLDKVHAVDAVPVVYARWKDYKDEHQCSACKEIVCVDSHTWKDIQFDFCPYCGAKMDGDT